MMSMKEEGKPVSFVEDCAVPLEHLADYTARLDRDVREARHARHLVRACRLGLPARAADPEPAAGQRRACHARDRRRGLRHGARIQGLAFRRARRRAGALGIQRADVRLAAGARLRGGEGPLRSARPLSIRARWCAPPKFDDRSLFRYAPGYRGEDYQDAARLVGLSRRRRRFPGRGRDVQQQRRLPQIGRRRDVPELSRHPRRARRHARPRQYAAARRHRPARAGRARLRRDGGDAEALRVLQGLPARMPDRRRHGAHEDRGAGGARRETRPVAARPAGRLSAALRAVRRRGAPGCSTCATAARRCGERPSCSLGFSARRSLPRWRTDIYRDRSDWRYDGAEAAAPPREVVLFADTFNRYFERENLDAALARAGRRRLSRASGAAQGRRRAPALLRPHFPRGRPGRRGQAARCSARSMRSRLTSRAACR